MIEYKKTKDGKSIKINVRVKDKLYPTCLMIDFSGFANNANEKMTYELTRSEWSSISNSNATQTMNDFEQAEKEFKSCDKISDIKNKATIHLLKKVDNFLDKIKK